MQRERGRRTRICLVSTTPFPLIAFMRPHVEALRADCDVTLVANGSPGDVATLLGHRVSFSSVRIERRISIVRDCLALIRLFRLFRAGEFDCVHSIMPKSGLLAMVAARLAGVPVRLHTFTGQVWATRSGLERWLLKTLDRVLVTSATMTLADSPSQRRFVVGEGVAKADEMRVLADGSICGVDPKRFAFDAEVRKRVRRDYGVSDDGFVFLYLGRLNKDKGVGDLLRAFPLVAEQSSVAHLVVVGPDEAGFDADFRGLAEQFPGRVHRVGFAERPEDFMCASDVLCLPSHREGFANVIIEAAAVGIPSIASDIYGVTDAVERGVTGLLHTPRSIPGIVDSMLRLMSDAPLRREMGAAARTRAVTRFSEERVTGAFLEFYREHGLAVHPT